MTHAVRAPTLVNRSFVALFAASFVFVGADCIVLPIASPFATTRLGTDAAGRPLAATTG